MESNAQQSPFRRAVLYGLAPGGTGMGPIVERGPLCLVPLAGRCMVDRIAGTLADSGVEELDVWVAEQADLIAEFLGDGTRWGIRISIQDVRSSEQALGLLKRLQAKEAVLLGDLYCWPGLHKPFLERLVEQEKNLVIVDENGEPTGWGVVVPGSLPSGAEKTLEAFLSAFKEEQESCISAPAFCLECRNPRQILASCKALLHNQAGGQLISGASGDAGIWIGAGTVIHPSVELEPPVWIGENCRLERGVHAGPDVCVADDCVLDEMTVLKNTSILSGTCVGRQVELEDVVVDRNYLAYLDSDRAVAVPDRFLIAPNRQLNPVDLFQNLGGRVIAFLMWVALLPLWATLLLIGLILCRPLVMVRKNYIRLPAEQDSILWKNFQIRQWADASTGFSGWVGRHRILNAPMLLQEIAFGHLRWVGLRPRSRDEVEALPEDWRMLYLSCRPGLFQLAELERWDIGDASPEQQYSSEAFYACTRNLRLDLRIFLRSFLGIPVRMKREEREAILSGLSGPEMLDQLHQFMNEQFASRFADIEQEVRNNILTALHEACTNVLLHAYENQPGKPLQVHLSREAEALVVDLYDRGVGFEPGEIPEPDFSGDSEGGFGWFLICSMTESACWSRTDSGWNRLSLKFNCNPEGESQDDDKHEDVRGNAGGGADAEPVGCAVGADIQD